MPLIQDYALSQVYVLQIEQKAVEISSQQDLERKIIGLQNEVQVLIHFLSSKTFLSLTEVGRKKHITARLIILLICFFVLQCIEHAMSCLEEQQDEFDFKYQTFQMEGGQLQFHFNLRTMFSEDD